jgi:hypothetical protein
MPVATSYPGVYIEEIPSGVRTITGVATSITAFVGRALRGPTDQDETNSPVSINSFGEFERVFGGLWTESTLGFAVRDFFLNGGSRAIVVRVYKASPAPAKSTAKLSAGNLKLVAASPGAWGGKLRVRIDHDTRTDEAFDGEDVAKLFNLTVKDNQTSQTELFRNISVETGHPRRVDKVLENESTLLRVDGGVPASRPAKDDAITAGTDPNPFSNDFTGRYTSVSTANLPTDGVLLTEKEISAFQYSLQMLDVVRNNRGNRIRHGGALMAHLGYARADRTAMGGARHRPSWGHGSRPAQFRVPRGARIPPLE